jgi:hypothetical protein
MNETPNGPFTNYGEKLVETPNGAFPNYVEHQVETRPQNVNGIGQQLESADTWVKYNFLI